MGKRVRAWTLVLVLCFAVAMGVVGNEYEGETRREGGGGEGRQELFLLQEAKHVVKTDAGQMTVVRGFGGSVLEKPLHIGFINMEPKTLFVPQYMDSSLIIFIRSGEAKIGTIYKDELVEKHLKVGDVFRIAAGSAFYMVNTGEGQRLHVICSIDPSQSLGVDVLQSFYIGGGKYPRSLLAGFTPETLATAFNVSVGELKEVLTRQREGPIMYIRDSHQPSVWTKFLQLEKHERLEHMKKMVKFEEVDQEEEQAKWSWRKLLVSVFGKEEKKRDDNKGSKTLDSYNIYDAKPDFQNDYGWSIAVDEEDYDLLKLSGIGVYLVNLTAGSMMAPHVNPVATEYGIVLRGSGNIQVVFPNGSLAMNAQVKEGDVFWVPRYFPFCQIASRSGPMEFFGFTTSSHKSQPQFLAGARSVPKTMRGPEIATAFGVSLETFDHLINAQNQAVILPPREAAVPPLQVKQQQKEEGKTERVAKVIKSLGSEMIMGFD